MSAEEQSTFIKNALAKHNEYRKNHGAPPLKHNPSLSRVALSWAQNIASRNAMQHSNCDFNGTRMGENIAMFSSPQSGLSPGAYSTKMWYDEIKDYRYSNPGFAGATGHFTQVVWKSTTEVGFGVAYARNGYQYTVANYLPAGNFQGQFRENVLPYGTPASGHDEASDDFEFTEEALKKQVYPFRLLNGAICDSCKWPIFGTRFKCQTCDNYDLCRVCKNSNAHEHDSYDKIKTTEAAGAKSSKDDFNLIKEIFVFSRMQNGYCDGCFRPVFGTKYSCDDCSNYLLCKLCIDNGAHNEHTVTPCEVTKPEKINNQNFEKIKKLFPFKHLQNVVCDGCQAPVFGTRYACKECNDFDLCFFCKNRGEHEHDTFVETHA